MSFRKVQRAVASRKDQKVDDIGRRADPDALVAAGSTGAAEHHKAR